MIDHIVELELTKHITLHDADGEPLLKRSSSHSFLPNSTTVTVVLFLTSEARSKVNLLCDNTY